jgi:Xaa-Pro dipeptidase
MTVSRREFFKIGGLSIAAAGWTKSLFSNARPTTASELKNMVTDVKPLTPEDYRMRLEKAQRMMAENGIDGLLLTGSTNLVYFTKVNWWRSERTFGAVLNPKKDPVWVSPAFELQRATELVPKGQEVRTWEEHESPFKLIGGIMEDLGARGGKLALGPTIRSFVYYGLRKDAPALQLVDGSVVTEGCRGIKAEKELAYMDLANRITKMAYREGFKNLREGMSRGDLGGIIRNAHQQMGVTGGGGPLFGPSSAFPHGTLEEHTLHKGDNILVDGGCGLEGYRSDVTRTIVFGTPTDRQKKVWDVVLKAQLAAHKAVRPGVPCEEIDRAARKVIEEAGFGPDYKYFTHRLGHGIGMEGHEYPYLVRGNKLKLQPGMTFSNEPGIYIYGEFGVRIEDCFVVTEDGARFLGGMESTAIDEPFGE